MCVCVCVCVGFVYMLTNASVEQMDGLGFENGVIRL